MEIFCARRCGRGNALMIQRLKIIKDMTQCHLMPFSITPRDGG
jgi:hypothetical protein